MSSVTRVRTVKVGVTRNPGSSSMTLGISVPILLMVKAPQNMYVLRSTYVFSALAVWWWTIERPRLQNLQRKLAAAGLALLFISKLRWAATVRRMDEMFMW